MDTAAPIVKKFAWLYTIPQLILILLLTGLFWKLFVPASLSTAAGYAALAFLRVKVGAA